MRRVLGCRRRLGCLPKTEQERLFSRQTVHWMDRPGSKERSAGVRKTTCPETSTSSNIFSVGPRCGKLPPIFSVASHLRRTEVGQRNSSHGIPDTWTIVFFLAVADKFMFRPFVSLWHDGDMVREDWV